MADGAVIPLVATSSNQLKETHMAASIHLIRSHNETIALLTRLKLIVSMEYRGGFLCARYGVNKATLRRAAKRMDGE